MKVLYLSEAESLQVIEIEDFLNHFLKNGAPSGLLKVIALSLDTQGFYTGVWGLGSFTVINLSLPENNILTLSDEELIVLKDIMKYGKSYIDQPNASIDEGIEVLRKIKELLNVKYEPKEEKIAHEGISKLNYPG